MHATLISLKHNTTSTISHRIQHNCLLSQKAFDKNNNYLKSLTGFIHIKKREENLYFIL